MATMSKSEFRAVYTGIGGALVVAGLAVAANWLSVVYAAAKTASLSVAGPIFYVGLGVLALGIYAFVAAMSDSKRLWLPGKKTVILSEIRAGMAQSTSSLAQIALARAHLAGCVLRFTPDSLKIGQFIEWQRDLHGLVTCAWGTREVVLLNVEVPQTPTRSEPELTLELVNRTMERLESLLARAHTVPLEADAASWRIKEYDERFFTAVAGNQQNKSCTDKDDHGG